MGRFFSDYVNDCQSFWSGTFVNNPPTFQHVTNPPHVNHKNPYPGFEVSVFNDPAYENNIGGFNGGDETQGGLLILGFNPAGTAKYRAYSNPINNSPNAIRRYDPFTDPITGVSISPIDPYTKAIKDFANDCGYGNGNEFEKPYYKIDAFGIMQSTQKTLENDIIKNGNYNIKNRVNYDPVLYLSISTIIKLRPKIIVFANAGLRRLFINNHLFTNFVNITGWNSQPYKIAMDIELKDINGNKYPCLGIFTTMLSGGHLDNGTRDILIRVIRNL